MKPAAKHRPLNALPRLLVGRHRSAGSDLALATVLAAIAGAANAGGFFALGQYTSHMTGHLSQLADNLALLNWIVVLTSLMAIGAFITGAAFSTALINWARSQHGRHQYALPLAIQGLLMICFSWGGIFSTAPGRLFALACLCFIMGMQNATITKISGARIRTTHATGMITDIGIELGRGAFGLASGRAELRWDRRKLAILLRLVLAFLLGGLVGALGYGQFGFFFSLPLAAALLGLSLPTLLARRRGGGT
ncbi:MAG: YoaK family protein [Cereibacter changlensis]